MSTGHEDHLLGRLALHYKLITQDQLADATAAQAREGGFRRLGEILVQSGLLTPGRLEQLLAAQREVIAKRQAAAASPGVAAPPGAPPPTLPPMVQGPALAPLAQASPLPPPVPTSLAAPGAAAGKELDRLLEYAVGQGASDVHLHSHAGLRLRRNGRLGVIEGFELAPGEAERIVAGALSPEQQAALAERGQIDLAYTVPGVGRFRANVYRQQRGLDAIFRAIPPAPPTLSALGLPLSLARLANFHQGLVLLTGPAGCGKSSTMAALINIVNEERRDHIVTIEDPIEFLHISKRSLVNQRQVGRHTGSFARALRAALREDPDVIAIGELRDLETVALALTAAETGHLVMATLHTSNAIRTVNRILGVFPPAQQEQVRTMVSESLRAVVSQRLALRADGRGRVPALEVLVANKAVGNLIRENKTFQIRSVLQTGAAQGMCLLDSSLAELAKSGAITREEAVLLADDPTRFSTAGAPAPAAPA